MDDKTKVVKRRMEEEEQPMAKARKLNEELKSKGLIRVTIHGCELYTKPEMKRILMNIGAKQIMECSERLIIANIRTGKIERQTEDDGAEIANMDFERFEIKEEILFVLSLGGIENTLISHEKEQFNSLKENTGILNKLMGDWERDETIREICIDKTHNYIEQNYINTMKQSRNSEQLLNLPKTTKT